MASNKHIGGFVMIEKIKLGTNKKYTTIAVYVIITVMIIFGLAFLTTKLEIIFENFMEVLRHIGKILTPVFIGVAIAYIIDPVVMYFERLYRKIRFIRFKKEENYRIVAVFSCIILVTFILVVLIGLFVFSITKQISSIGIDEVVTLVVNYINSFSDSLKGIEDKLVSWNIESKSIESYIADVSTNIIGWFKNFANNLATYTMDLSGYISNCILGLIIAIYLLIDKNDFIKYGNRFLKAAFKDNTQKKIKSSWEDFDKIFSGYIRGELMDSLFMCVTLSLALSIIGIKFGVLIGVLAGLCNLIPFFGPIVAQFGTIFFGVLNAQYTQVFVAITALIIIQQIDANIVEPKLLGHSVSLKPVVIMVTVIIGADLGGILGMILAVPTVGLLKIYIKRYIDDRLEKKEVIEIEKN
jgi:predicted PurR-regulated permease PerM